jgi:hypothetical protein
MPMAPMRAWRSSGRTPPPAPTISVHHTTNTPTIRRGSHACGRPLATARATPPATPSGAHTRRATPLVRVSTVTQSPSLPSRNSLVRREERLRDRLSFLLAAGVQEDL